MADIHGARTRTVGKVLDSERWGGYHPFVARLERAFAEFQQCRHGIAAVNGTVTLEMALEALGIGAGDEVIVPAISFVSTATAVSRVGATPVFVDIEGDTFNIDPHGIERAHHQRDEGDHGGSFRRANGGYGPALRPLPRRTGCI